MFLNTPYDESTWELLVAALQGDMTPEEETQFKQWLESSEQNRAFFEQLLGVWKHMDDLPVLEKVNDEAAWSAFQQQLGERQAHSKDKAAVPFTRYRWLAAAAVIILAAGAVWWTFTGKGSASTFETARGEQRTISLTDGSTVTLQPETRLRLAQDFNKNGKERTVFLLSGTARFEVAHDAAKVFSVETDAIRVQDIGTQFTIEKSSDSVVVSVSSGMVAVSAKTPGAGQPKNIAAGGAVVMYTGGSHQGELRQRDEPLGFTDSLQFNDVPLSEVLAALEKQSGRSVRLTDPAMGQKRITIKLGGESLEDALRLICASMHLEYALRSGGYVLDKRDSARRR